MTLRRRRTNRLTGATGSDFRIIIGPAQMLGNAWPGQLRRYPPDRFVLDDLYV